MSKARKVVHVELKEPYNGKRHWYFGSVEAIYDTLSPDIVGVAKTTLWNVFGKERKYTSKTATIRVGWLLSHNTNRGKRHENRAND